MKPVSLDELFNNKIFRIPDYQRGYAWKTEQLRQFWDDLVNLGEGRSHYTGLITMRKIPADNFSDRYQEEHWLVDEHSHRAYHIVDGQQRLTTCIVFLQAFVELMRSLTGNEGKCDSKIFVSDTLTVHDTIEKYIYRQHPKGIFRTYKFGYDTDNPSYQFFRHKIIGEPASGTVNETFYTLNLTRAKEYFTRHLRELHESDGAAGLQKTYMKVTRSLLFNEYAIKDDFNVYVAFETMNNRGKKLSSLELLKNRLIYLVTLYTDDHVDAASRDKLRQSINDVWKGVYYQLGRNKDNPLNDDEFLRAHWIMYFGYDSRVKYRQFLLDDYFSPRRVLTPASAKAHPKSFLEPTKVKAYVDSLGVSAGHWFDLHFPRLVDRFNGTYEGDREAEALLKLDRVGFRYFRPLAMAVLKNEPDSVKRTKIFERIERFIFLVFHASSGYRSNWAQPQFWRAARDVDRGGKIDLDKVDRDLAGRMPWVVGEDGKFNTRSFQYLMESKFADGGYGYFAWSGLKHLLFEYELHLQGPRPKKVSWEYLTKSRRDVVTVEHIAPRGPREDTGWRRLFESHSSFRGLAQEDKDELYHKYVNSLGNLLLLSNSVNAGLRDFPFERKKEPMFDDKTGKTVRDGYKNGSHSELQVAEYEKWGPDEIRERGMKLLTFFEERWGVEFRSKEEKENLLMLPANSSPARSESGSNEGAAAPPAGPDGSEAESRHATTQPQS